MERLSIDLEWSGGFRARFELTNEGGGKRGPVTADFLADAEIGNIWNGTAEEIAPAASRSPSP